MSALGVATALAVAVGILGLAVPIAADSEDPLAPRYTLMEPGLPAKSPRPPAVTRVASPAAIPEIYGPGAVLTVGNVYMKVTNFGVIGNPFTNLSSDPSGQWPGPSGVEYLNAIVLAVGAVNPMATDPTAARRVSSGSEWRPPTLDAVDRIYRAFEGVANGRHLFNDDGDRDPVTLERKIDEDFLDGRDNDGDGRIDEDYAALGQLMFSCVMRDDTPGALAAAGNERHVPLGLECQQVAWAYSIPRFANFSVVEYTIYNRSGQVLDSLYVGFPTDLDAGSVRVSAAFFLDDQDLPFFPNGEFTIPVSDRDPRYQGGSCAKRKVRVHGFSVVDNDGDQGETPGVASLLLLGHTVDPLGLRAPTRVGFKAFRSYPSGTSFASNGAPSTDQQRFEIMRSQENIDPETGFIQAMPSGVAGDYAAWNAIGPFRNLPDGGSITATIALAVERGAYHDLIHYPADYAQYRMGLMTLEDLLEKYPALTNALAVQVAYEGTYERPRLGTPVLVPDCSGCETGIRLPKGSPPTPIARPACHEGDQPPVQWLSDVAYTWFNWDCDPCTGVRGHYLRPWGTLGETPPVAPNLNVASTYNYSDNPNRVVAPGDGQITVAWDNLSENVPDPKTGWLDFRSYRLWKAAGWRRPVGSAGPTDDDWALLAEFRLFDYADSNITRDPVADTLICPKVWVPGYEYPRGHPHCEPGADLLYPTRTMLSRGGCRDSATVGICLRNGDLWDRQSGFVLRPHPDAKCVRGESGGCAQDSGWALATTRVVWRTRYEVGRYRYVDREVKNGFLYFYSVTAGDSTGGGELFGRHWAVEADAVTPQASTRAGTGAWVVPNPYRGFRNISERPSAWDLTPSATDPTGTHIDFMGLPPGRWTVRIFTVSGDLVAELHSDDPVNDSVRSPAVDDRGAVRPGYNRQRDHPNDGQARWNLISRNGQDVASGIYLFVVDSDQGQQRGKFVVIR